VTPNLRKFVNKTILVSIPVLSGDTKCRAYTLTGIELIGLWLEGTDLAAAFLPHEHKSQTKITWSFFVPFSQIACVAFPAAAVAASGSGTTAASQSLTPAQAVPPTAVRGSSGPSKSVGATRKKQRDKEG